MQVPKDVVIYTRGIGTPNCGAFGALLVCDGRERELSGGEVGASNNRMDLLAAVEALGALKWSCRVKLYNTNSYLTDGMTKGWAERWRENGWTTAEGKPTAHSDLWEQLLTLCSKHTVEFVWVPTSEELLEYRRCDKLAREFVAEAVDIPVRPCAGCGRPIPPERLEALPDATKCVACQKRTESTAADLRVSELECPQCGRHGFKARMVWRTARDPAEFSGYFLGCSRFPECRYVDRS